MYRYRKRDRLRFIASYFYYRATLPLEIRSPRLALTAYEAAYSLNAVKNVFLGSSRRFAYPFDHREIISRFGRFEIRPSTLDAAMVSPAFERLDLNHLLKFIAGERARGRRVVFCDIGADVGTFSITVGNRFRDDDDVHILAFEPSPSSFELLRRNIELNGLPKVTPLNVALGAENGEVKLFEDRISPGNSSLVSETREGTLVELKTLDDVLAKHYQEAATLVLKLDVEGYEAQVLRGAKRLLKEKERVHLMVEDFVDARIIDLLQGEFGMSFVGKLTDYNSWWTTGPK